MTLDLLSWAAINFSFIVGSMHQLMLDKRLTIKLYQLTHPHSFNLKIIWTIIVYIYIAVKHKHALVLFNLSLPELFQAGLGGPS